MSFADWIMRVFSRPKASPHMVRFFDTERHRVVQMPASELAPGVFQARVEGVEGVVWIEASKVRQSDLRHPELSEELREYVRRIRTAFLEHRDLSLEEWEEGFRRDADPVPEIAYWSHAAGVYLAFAASESSPERRRGIYECVVTCLVASPDTVCNVLKPSALSRSEIEEIIRRFYGKRDGRGDGDQVGSVDP